MSQGFVGVLRHHPEVTFFLVLGIGYVLGKVKLGGFTLGAVTGTLLAGVVVGQLGVQVSGEVKQCFFLLFLFSIGFRTGPQFFRGLKSDGLQQAALSAIIATTGPRRGVRRQSSLSATTPAPRRASSPARSPSPRRSAPRATRSRGWACRRPTRPR